MKIERFHILLLFMMLVNKGLTAQNDTLSMNTSETLIGEIKFLDNGIINIETRYSDSDFEIEWDKVKYIHTTQQFVIITADGNRYYGTLKSDKDSSSLIVLNDPGVGESKVNIEDILFLKKIDQTFWSRLDLLMSVGYNLAKANNSHQFIGSIKTGYLSKNFKTDLHLSALRSTQSSDDFTSDISRTEAGLGFLFFVYKDWFAITRSDLLQSSEQKLNLRAITKAGIGNYVLKNNRMNLGLAGGAAWNYENYYEDAFGDKNSVEAFAALEYNIFDLGDLDLLTRGIAYPSLSEKGRFRTDFSFNLKYEFPLDFFIDLGFTLNYDNQPAEGASPSDYIFQTTLGWEL